MILFITVAILANGLFISKVNAEEVSGDITENIHWTLADSPYVVTSDIYIVSGATLTIDAGVVVKFDYGTSLVSYGNIEALGTESNPINFTSFYDDSLGGDTDGDEEYCYYNTDEEGNNIGEEFCETYDYEPEEGDWNYIFINSESKKSLLNNVVSMYSNDGLIVMDGGSVDSVNFSSDKGISLYGSKGNSFTGLNIRYIEISSSSSATIANANIVNEGVEEYLGVVSVYGESSLNISNSVIQSDASCIVVYDNSSLSSSDLSLKCEDDGIYLYSNSSLDLSGGDINSGNNGVYVFSNSTALISGVKISGALEAGLMAHSNQDTDAIKITKSEITGNENGFIIFGSSIAANENSIHDNTSTGAMTYDSDPLSIYNYNFTSNFWGDKTGPTHSSNASGLGDPISDGIIYSPFLSSDPLINTRNPVILIPGITGSYLNRNYGDKDEIWPDVLRLMLPGDDDFLNELILNDDGTEKAEFPIIPGDIIRGISTVDVFGSLIESLEMNGYIEGIDLFVFPYDWRLITESSSFLLKDKIDEIILKTGQDKVDIVAHSMGGLVAKKYIKDNGEEKINKLIFLGTPQLGSPKAFKVLMYGDNMGYKLDLYKDNNLKINFLNPLRAKYISQNMPSVYELLPSLKYIEDNGGYVNGPLYGVVNIFEPTLLDYLGTKNLMIENGRNPLMFPFAEDLHTSIDDLDLSGMKSYNFTGCGSATIGGITLTHKRSWKSLFLGFVDDFKLKYTDGDETVPFVSATKTIGANIYYAKGISHGSLPASGSIIKGILSVLKGEDIPFDDVLSSGSSSCGIEGNIVSTHSPVELHIYDEEGKHTGLKEDGDIEYGIEGVSFDVIEGENYAFLPEGKNFKVITKATDTGGYNFIIEEQNKDEAIVNTYNWNLIPLSTLDTTGEIWVGPDYIPTEYSVKIDADGDGGVDENYMEGFDGTELAEKATKKEEKTRSSSIIGTTPKKEKSENWGGHNFIDNIKIEKEEKIVLGNGKSKGVENKIVIKSENEKIENKEIIKNRLLASAGSLDFKINNYLLFIITGGSILVLLLAIKFIIKVK